MVIVLIRKAIVISIISIIVVLLLFGTKVLNIQNMEEMGRDASSYHDISAYIYTICGLLMILVAFWTYRVHIVAGIIPFGLGAGCLFYGLYILWAKGVIAL